MQKAVVIYKSKYGTTEKYARWIAEDLSAPLLRVEGVTPDRLQEYDVIVYCGGLYAGGILGFSFLKKHYPQLASKRILVAAVGATLDKDTAPEKVRDRNIPPEMAGNVEFFMLRGGLNYPGMNPMDRFLMYLMHQRVKKLKPEELDNDGKGILATYGKVVDFTNRASIAPIVEAVRRTHQG